LQYKIKILILIIFLSLKCDITKEKEKLEYEKIKYSIDDNFIENKQNGIFKIIEPLWWSVSIYDGESKYFSDLRMYSIEQRYIFAITWYTSEVNNGGHGQFYDNSTGIVAEDALEGFKKIGLIKNYEILKESMQRIGGKVFKDRQKRQEQLEKYQPDFEDLDNKFYNTNPEEKMMEYIKENKRKFHFQGIVSTPK